MKDKNSKDLYVSWDEYHHQIEQLALKIYQSDWKFNQIVCLAKGGLRVGDVLARLYDVPLAILSTASYRGSSDNCDDQRSVKDHRGTLVFSDDLTKTTQHLGSHILLVDDLVDSGITLQKTIPWLDRKYGFYIEEVRSAVLWYKSCSIIKPDYYVDYLDHNPWIHQPFEKYETMKPGDLKSLEHAGKDEGIEGCDDV
ncbi:MAG: phosphoribosyltransferase family protein [Cyanobacteria bacterium]|nr:phosphoribosyltransferase family protein [Cyanobacteriota bacterium]